MRRSADIVSSLPINAPTWVIFLDIYAAGPDINFDGNRHHLIADFRMTGFAVSKYTLDQNAKTLASTLMKIWLQFRFPHTIVVNKSTSFLNVFNTTSDSINIHIHVFSGESHDPMIVK